MWQFVKLCFEVAERYVVTAVLVLMAPLAFGLGGSKSTEDIFKGWCRMFASMCLMMVMNIIFLKLLISAMGYVPSGLGVLPWMLLIVGIARVARKMCIRDRFQDGPVRRDFAHQCGARHLPGV